MLLSGPVLEMSLFSVVAEVVVKNLPEQQMEFIKIHVDFISCGDGFLVVHVLTPCAALDEFSGSDTDVISQNLP